MVALLLVLYAPALSAELSYPPVLAGGEQVVTDRTPAFLKAPVKLRPGVTIAETPPTVGFLYYPEQEYKGNPWSAWGDGLAARGTYYSSIGDHRGPGGNAFVYEYEAQTKKLRTIVNLRKLLNLPEGHYTPGKIHIPESERMP